MLCSDKQKSAQTDCFLGLEGQGICTLKPLLVGKKFQFGKPYIIRSPHILLVTLRKVGFLLMCSSVALWTALTSALAL